MTMQSDQLIGAQVTGGDGEVVGTVQQIFNDDRDGTPVWARIRAGTQDRFVPLAGSKVTKNGLSVPYDANKIMSSPDIGTDRHMSAAQTEELRNYFGLSVPAQGGPPDVDTQRGQAEQGQAQGGQGQGGQTVQGQAQSGQTQQDQGLQGQGIQGQGVQGQAQTGQAQDRGMQDQTQAGRGQRGQAQGGQVQQDASQRGQAQAAEDWLIRAEEQVNVGTETVETGRARLHKYVDVVPVEQDVHVYHEEYTVERVPIGDDEQVSGEIGEGVQEVVLHEERAVFQKEAVPLERVRLVVNRVGEDRTFRDEVRRERVEVEADGGGQGQGQQAGQAQQAQDTGRRR
jgi:uncharacterized protein (TIGR02271 family)